MATSFTVAAVSFMVSGRAFFVVVTSSVSVPEKTSWRPLPSWWVAAFFMVVRASFMVGGHVLRGGWPRVLRGGHGQRVGPGRDIATDEADAVPAAVAAFSRTREELTFDFALIQAGQGRRLFRAHLPFPHNGDDRVRTVVPQTFEVVGGGRVE